MPEPTIGAARNPWRPAQHDYACGPPPAEACDHPHTSNLKKREYHKPERIDGPIIAKHPQAEQPRSMQRDHKRVVRCAEFDPALCAQPAGIEMCETKLDEPLRQHEREQPGALTHAQPRARASLR